MRALGVSSSWDSTIVPRECMSEDMMNKHYYERPLCAEGSGDCFAICCNKTCSHMYCLASAYLTICHKPG